MNLHEAYLVGHKACGLKVGDTVKILRIAKDNEQGWTNFWDYAMDETINQIGRIKEDTASCGFQIIAEGHFFNYPWFVLEKVEEKTDGEIFEQKLKAKVKELAINWDQPLIDLWVWFYEQLLEK